MAIGILLVDPQNDFFPGGSLGVRGGDQIVRPINELLGKFPDALLFVSRDWHPPETKHFAARGGPWPPHCVQGTKGAAFHKDLKLKDPIVVTKGTNPEDDGGYSAFDGTVDYIGVDGKPNPSHKGSLSEALAVSNVDMLIVAGLATDYCVRATVLDALKNGLKVFLFRPGIRAVDIHPDDGHKAIVLTKGSSMCVGQRT